MKQRLAFLVVGAFLWTSLLAQERVKFTLDWVIDGQQTPFLLTQGRGYFRDHGLNVTLDAEHAAKLARLAERTHTQEGTLARSLLSHALDEADPDPRHVADLLDSIPDAWERAVIGHEQALAGRTIPLREL